MNESEDKEHPWHWKAKKEHWGDWSRGWRDPLGGVVFGLMVIWLGVCLFFNFKGIVPPGTWWAYMLVGFGGLWILGGLVRLFVPRWRRGVLGSLIPGIILGAIGLMFIFDSWSYWPWILVAVGAVIVIAVIVRAITRRRRREDVDM